MVTGTKPAGSRTTRRAAAAPKPRGTRDAQARAKAAALPTQVVQVLSAQDLTLGEAELFEELTGYAPMDFLRVATQDVLRDFQGNPVLAPDETGAMKPVFKTPPTKIVAVLHYLYMRRENPDYTLEEARKKSPADFVVTGGDPTPAAATN